jgi:hypothetical protein
LFLWECSLSTNSAREKVLLVIYTSMEKIKN